MTVRRKRTMGCPVRHVGVGDSTPEWCPVYFPFNRFPEAGISSLGRSPEPQSAGRRTCNLFALFSFRFLLRISSAWHAKTAQNRFFSIGMTLLVMVFPLDGMGEASRLVVANFLGPSHNPTARSWELMEDEKRWSWSFPRAFSHHTDFHAWIQVFNLETLFESLNSSGTLAETCPTAWIRTKSLLDSDPSFWTGFHRLFAWIQVFKTWIQAWNSVFGNGPT